MRRLASVALLLALGACSDDDGVALRVDVRTDLVPGLEFDVVELARVSSATESARILEGLDYPASMDDDFATGVRVGSFEIPAEGDVFLRARLLDPAGTRLAEQNATVTVAGEDVGVTITLTRSCVGVRCPSDADPPSATACQGGACVAPGPLQRGCENDGECPAPVATCAEARCVEGYCFQFPISGACGAAQVCDPTVGCRDVMISRDGGTTCIPSEELCDNVDNDCDGFLDEADPAGLGSECDGADVGACPEGQWQCLDGTLLCTDDTGDDPDLCDGDTMDDCDPSTDDGAGESWFGLPCDGIDTDFCEEGAWECRRISGVYDRFCGGDDRLGNAELCNGEDDDCDGTTDEMLADPMIGMACDGPDADMCETGTTGCSGGAYTCEGDSVRTESCNAMDDDCDMLIDEEGCPSECIRFMNDRSVYLVCAVSGNRGSARNYCLSRGYDLAKIESMSENNFLAAQVGASSADEFWIGLEYIITGMMIGTRWADGTPGPRLGGGFPPFSETPPASSSCVYLDGADGSWKYRACGTATAGLICETSF